VKIITYALIPLILSIGISPAIPFSAGIEYSQICIDKVWIEKNSSGKIACVTPSTADKLVERGWGTILADDTFDEKPIEEELPLGVQKIETRSGTITFRCFWSKVHVIRTIIILF